LRPRGDHLHGKLLALDSPAQLKRSVPGGYLVQLQVRGEVPPPFVEALRSLPGVVEVKGEQGQVRVLRRTMRKRTTRECDARRGRSKRHGHRRARGRAEFGKIFFLHLTGRIYRE